MNTTMRNDDSDLDKAIRKSLGDIIASGHPGRTASEPAAGLTDRYSGRRWLASAAAVVLVVAGLGVISARSSDSPAPADQTSGSAQAPSLPARANGPNDLNPDGLINPVATTFGGLVDPLLPDGYELVFASDDPEPLVVALNAGGDRFEAVIYSSESRLAEVDRIRDELQLEVPEGVLAVGPNGQPSERNSYLVTDDAIVATDYTRIADPSTIEPGSAVDVARAIARNLPPELATGAPVAVGTGLFNDVTAAVESLAERVQESGGDVRSTKAPTIEVTGDFTSSIGNEPATVRVEMFGGFTAPTFLESRTAGGGARPQVARVGAWLVIVTIDGAVSEDSSALETIEVVSKTITGRTDTGASEPASPTTLPIVDDYTLLALDPLPDGYQLSQARYTADTGGFGIARYTTPDSSTELHVVIRDSLLPVGTLESLDRDTWEFDGQTVWSDGELNGCLSDVCSIGLQWDDQTYVSLMWVEPQANDLASGSTEESLLALLPNLIESDTNWQQLNANPGLAGPADDVNPAAPVDAVPIVPGGVLVANANVTGGSAGKLTELLSASGFTVGAAENSTAINQPDTIVYVRQGAECLGIQVAYAIGNATTESMPDVLPVASPAAVSEPDVLIVLGNDIADQFGSEDYDIDIGPAGQLVVVDATSDDGILDSYLSELIASGIKVTDVLPATRSAAETTFHPIGETTPWTCGASTSIGIDGFDTWSPDIIDGELPDRTDAVLVVGN